MTLTPPDPGIVVKMLLEQLEQIRLLSETDPTDASYVGALGHMAAAIAMLEHRGKQKK